MQNEPITYATILGYTVRILGNSIKLAQLETQTMMLLDPFPPISSSNLSLRNESDATKAKKCQYEPVFMQLADENKYIKDKCSICN